MMVCLCKPYYFMLKATSIKNLAKVWHSSSDLIWVLHMRMFKIYQKE